MRGLLQHKLLSYYWIDLRSAAPATWRRTMQMPIRTCTSLTANTPRGCLVLTGMTPKTGSWRRTRSTTTMTGTGSATGPGPRIATDSFLLPDPGMHRHSYLGHPLQAGWS